MTLSPSSNKRNLRNARRINRRRCPARLRDTASFTLRAVSPWKRSFVLLLVIGVAILAPAAISAADFVSPGAEVRDVILMLDSPLHLRLRISIAGQSPTQSREAMVARLIKSLDTNGDGKLSREEAQNSPLFREKQRPNAEKFLKTLGADLTMSRKDLEKRIEQIGGETVVYRQNTEASDSDGQVFKLLDADHDGMISEAEMFNAVDRLLAKDLDDDECVTLDEFTPPPDRTVNPVPALMNRPAPSSVAVAEIIRDTHQTLLPAQMLAKYDKDRNRKLSTEELGWSREKIATCDLDNDGELNLKELGGLQRTPVDVELAVDIVKTTGQPMLRVISVAGQRIDGDRFPDLATLEVSNAVVTLSTREVDPFEASLAIALRTFNELDVDNNGYIDREEAMGRERLGRSLFDQIDADGDGKIFGEEMKTFIRARGEPIASTCQVMLFDDGAGFFAVLDANGDRRISMREMRYADKTLARMKRDDQPGLRENEPVRRYRIEFTRGIFNPFGASDPIRNPRLPQDVVAAAKPRAVGPVWFQRWDRNNDGDITWREFLGPRNAFERLDVDGDDLIDPKEAEAAAKMMNSPSPNPKPELRSPSDSNTKPVATPISTPTTD